MNNGKDITTSFEKILKMLNLENPSINGDLCCLSRENCWRSSRKKRCLYEVENGQAYLTFDLGESTLNKVVHDLLNNLITRSIISEDWREKSEVNDLFIASGDQTAVCKQARRPHRPWE